MSIRGTASLSAALVLWVLAASCGQVNIADDGGASATNSVLGSLQTEVVGLRQTQADQATALAEQAAQITRFSGLVSHLATVVPRAKPTVYPPTITPFVPFEGDVLFEEGRCCAGGRTGEPLTLHAELWARSQNGEAVEMRTRLGMGAATLGDMTEQPWEPFRPQVTFEIVPGVNWVGYFASAQFRDSKGATSDVIWDDISVEGMPSGASSTP